MVISSTRALHPLDRVKMADVARQAGVSVATVSRALRDVDGVSVETRARVRALAEKLSYVVSPEASGLSRRATGRVAVVVPRLDVWFYATVLAAIEAELRSADLDLLIYQVDGAAERRQFLEQLPARRKVDAIVIVALPLPPEHARRLDLMGVHVVVAGGRLRGYPSVHTENRALARAAVAHLVAQGHTKIAMIRTNETDGTPWSADVDRVRGYRDGLRASQVRPRREYLASVPYHPDAGSRAMHLLLDLPEPPTAVFAYSDDLALGAFSALVARGIDVPGQMSLIGVDGNPGAALFGIDTIEQSVGLQGTLAARMVVGLVHGETPTRTDVVVPWTLISRGSVQPPAVSAPGELRSRNLGA